MPKGRWITDRMVEKSSTSADVKFNTCSPRSVSRNAVPLFDDSLVISPAAHRWPIRVRILPWLIPISSASPSTLPVALLRLVAVFIGFGCCISFRCHVWPCFANPRPILDALCREQQTNSSCLLWNDSIRRLRLNPATLTDVVPVVIPEAGNVVHGLADELVDVIPDEDVCMTYGSVKKFRVHRALCFM